MYNSQDIERYIANIKLPGKYNAFQEIQNLMAYPDYVRNYEMKDAVIIGLIKRLEKCSCENTTPLKIPQPVPEPAPQPETKPAPQPETKPQPAPTIDVDKEQLKAIFRYQRQLYKKVKEQNMDELSVKISELRKQKNIV